MNARRWVGLVGCVWLVVAITILSACVPVGLRSLAASQETPPVAEATGPIRAYRAALHQEIQNPQANGAMASSVIEFAYTWQATDGPFGYDAQAVTSVTDPFSGKMAVMDDVYAVAGLAYQQAWNGWGARARTPEDGVESAALVPAGGTLPDSAALTRISGLPVEALVAESAEVGEELVGGLRATHYRLSDLPSLAAVISARLGVPPPPTPSPLEIQSAQLDIWLGVDNRLPVQYILQATGKKETTAGSGVATPFVIADRYSIGEINSGLSVEVPAEILAAVKAQK